MRHDGILFERAIVKEPETRCFNFNELADTEINDHIDVVINAIRHAANAFPAQR